LRENFIKVWDEVSLGSIYIVEPHPNLIGKFKPESNLIVVEPELEPEPCDLVCRDEIGGDEHFPW
jgi:hypothetical protein